MAGSEITGNAYLTCGLNGDLWTLTAASQNAQGELVYGSLYRREGVTRHDPAGDSWTLVDTGDHQMIHVSLGETGELWMVDAQNAVWRRTDMSDANPQGSAFEEVQHSFLEQLDVGVWEVWGVNIYNEVYRRTDLSNNNKLGATWEQVAGTMIYVSTAEQGVVWALDVEGDVWIYETGDISVEEQYDPETDDYIPAGPQDLRWKAVEVGRYGLVVALDTNHDLYHRAGTPNPDAPLGTGWNLLEDSQNFHSVSVCGTGRVWAVSDNGNGMFAERMLTQ
jgi:hypothetical protein